MDLYLPLILGTVRKGRHSEHVARFVQERIQQRSGIRTRFIDPRELNFGNLESRAIDSKDTQDPNVANFIDDMHEADGFVIVSPEYNYSFPGALKNLIDVTLKPWMRKPFAIVGCGGVSGGLRLIDSLRQVIAGVGAITISKHLSIQFVQKTFGPEGPRQDREQWEHRVDHMLEDLEWYARALKPARDADRSRSD